MTEKRFTLSQNGIFHSVYDNVENKPLGVFEFKDDEFPVYACFHRIIDLMNTLSEENEQLKNEKESWKKSWIEEMDTQEEQSKYILQLLNENEQLKKQLEYIQNSISEHIRHQKTELGQKALRKIIEDYNEWLLGHKRIQE